MFLNLYTPIPGTPVPSIYIGIVIVVFFFMIFDQFRNPVKDIVKRKSKIETRGFELIYTLHDDSKKDNVDYDKLLYSVKYNICGKPDYIFRKIHGKELVPVKLKDSCIGKAYLPNSCDLLELAAYFLLVEHEYGTKPKIGKLVYIDAMFVIKNTDKLRKELESTLNNMRDMLKNKELAFNAEGYFDNCKNCKGKGTLCDIV